jgi:hypothetical protein
MAVDMADILTGCSLLESPEAGFPGKNDAQSLIPLQTTPASPCPVTGDRFQQC